MKENNINATPLMFIQTLNNDEIIAKNQEYFDSRNKQNKIITKTHNTEFYVKISRLILMFNKNKRILCKVILLTNEQYNVIVKEMNNNIIKCINIDDDNKEISFNINEIDELTIEQINY